MAARSLFIRGTSRGARYEPTTGMNPIPMKPRSNMGSQIVLNGRVWQNLSAAAYYDHFDFLLDRVLDSYERLAVQFSSS